jgi:phosphatidylglycerophosphate synthase
VSLGASGASLAPSAADFRAMARADAGLFTQLVNYPVAARLCVPAYRLRVRPTVLTIANLVLGVGASVLVIVTAESVAAHSRTAVVVGVVAWLVWQVAYCFDCSDGQLARVASMSTAAGGRLDVLCDIAVQVSMVAAVAAVTTAARPGVPSWLVAAFAGSWMVNLVTSVMAKEGTNTSLITSGSLPVRLVKLIRDYGFMITVIAAAVAVRPAAMVWVMTFFAVVNCSFLLASIGQTSRAGLRGPAA